MVNANTEFFFGLVILAYWDLGYFVEAIMVLEFGLSIRRSGTVSSSWLLLSIGIIHWAVYGIEILIFFNYYLFFYTTERFLLSYNLCIFFSIASLSVWKLFYSVLCWGVIYYKDNIFFFVSFYVADLYGSTRSCCYICILTWVPLSLAYEW